MQNNQIIDLRSDTVTRPTPGMLEAMLNAKVGDDVFEDDPTVNELEKKAASMFGTEAAIFCASGTMTNQIAIKCHTRPGDEVICDKMAHIYAFEGGGIAFNSGASVKLIDGDRGRINAKQVRESIHPDNVHFPRTSLVAVENTMNKGGGCCYNFSSILEIAEVCKENKLAYHLDGARLFNALAVTNETPADYGKVFDSISICLSKGLGAPVGSLLLGTKAFVHQARRVRKVMGGGWRQAGFLAAAGVYALDNHVERLKEDHRRANAIYTILKSQSYVEDIMPQETNIVIFKLNDKISAANFLKKLEENNIRAATTGPTSIRFVMHLDITDGMVERMEETLKKITP